MTIWRPCCRTQIIRDRLAAIGMELVGSSPAELGSFVNAEIARWTDVIKRYNIKPE